MSTDPGLILEISLSTDSKESEYEEQLEKAEKHLQDIEDSYEDLRKDLSLVKRKIKRLQLESEEAETKDLSGELEALEKAKASIDALIRPYEDQVWFALRDIRMIKNSMNIDRVLKMNIREDSKLRGELQNNVNRYYRLILYAVSGNLKALLNDDPVMSISITIRGMEVYISTFSSVNSYGKELSKITTNNDKNMLKRIGYYGLCYLLNSIKKDHPEDAANFTVTLEASGYTSVTPDMSNLVKYYESMGFKVTNEDTLQEDIKMRGVPMRASFNSISEICYKQTGNSIKEIPIQVVRK
jgi:hypothetical protein